MSRFYVRVGSSSVIQEMDTGIRIRIKMNGSATLQYEVISIKGSAGSFPDITL